MGQSSSVNVAKSINDIIVRIASEIVQNTELTATNTIVITVADTEGDVIISGNTLMQTAIVNMSNLIDSMSTQDIQEKIRSQIDQLAKSLLSGFNVLTFANAKNTADNLVKSTNDILLQIKQSCTTQSSNLQAITVLRTRGSVRIENNVFSQMNTIFNECALKSINNNRVIQDIQNRIDQSSFTQLDGLNLVWLIAAVMLILLLPILIPLFAASSIVKKFLNNYLAPLLIIISLLFFGLYIFVGKEYMKTYYYTKDYSQTCKSGSRDSTIKETTVSPSKAIDLCLKSLTCKAVDGRLTTKDTQNTIILRDIPEFKFFSTVCFDEPELQPEPSSVFPDTDFTALKQTEKYNWFLYIAFAALISGVLTFIVNNNQTKGKNTFSKQNQA